MMLKRKSNPWARLKYLYVLPLTAVAVVAFARPEISRESSYFIINQDQVTRHLYSLFDISHPIFGVFREIIQLLLHNLQRIFRFLFFLCNRVLICLRFRLYYFYYLRGRCHNLFYGRFLYRGRDNLDYRFSLNIHSFSMSPKDKSEEILTKYNASDKQGVISVVTKGAIASGKIKEDDVKVVGYGRLSDRLPGDVKIRIRDGQIGKEKPLIIIDGVEQIKDDAIDKLNAKAA